MSLSRRTFFKRAAGVAAGAAVVPLVAKAKPVPKPPPVEVGEFAIKDRFTVNAEGDFYPVWASAGVDLVPGDVLRMDEEMFVIRSVVTK